MSVRVLTSEDAADYRALRVRALQEMPPAFGALVEDEPGSAETAARLIATPERCYFGAFEAARLVGTVRLSRYSAANEKHRAYLAGLYVEPAYRRRAHGYALVEAALHRARADPTIRRVNLNVVTGQRAAIRLYERFGFTVSGVELEAFTADGTFYDEQSMTLALDRSTAPGRVA